MPIARPWPGPARPGQVGSAIIEPKRMSPDSPAAPLTAVAPKPKR